MARALQDIITELNNVYDPQRQVYNSQMTQLDPQMTAEQQGLEAQKRDSFQQITERANRRGMFYSGIPVAEEQRYTASEFLPAVANLRAKYASQRFGLQEALTKLTAEQYNQANALRQKELDREEEQRQFNERLAAQERASRASGGGGGGGVGGFAPTFGGGAAVAAPVRNANRPAGEAEGIFNLIQQLRQSPGGVKNWGWANLAAEFNRRGINTARGSAADIALNRYFNAGNLPKGY